MKYEDPILEIMYLEPVEIVTVSGEENDENWPG